MGFVQAAPSRGAGYVTDGRVQRMFKSPAVASRPRITRVNADRHSQFWCLLTSPAESKPNRRIIKKKAIGVMLMAFSSQRQKIAAARKASRTPSNGLETANQKETCQPDS